MLLAARIRFASGDDLTVTPRAELIKRCAKTICAQLPLSDPVEDPRPNPVRVYQRPTLAAERQAVLDAIDQARNEDSHPSTADHLESALLSLDSADQKLKLWAAETVPLEWLQQDADEYAAILGAKHGVTIDLAEIDWKTEPVEKELRSIRGRIT